MVRKMNLQEALNSAKNTKRNFDQTIDLIINFKDLDMKKPENRIKQDISLPHGIGKPIKVCLIVESLLTKSKNIENAIIIPRDEIELYGKDKRKLKNLASEVKFFIAESTLMPLVGKSMGQVLAPRGMMPKPIPPSGDIEKMVNMFSSNVSVKTVKAPTIQCAVGTEKMEDEKIIQNIEAVYNSIVAALPKGKNQVKNILLKTSMGKPVKVE